MAGGHQRGDRFLIALSSVFCCHLSFSSYPIDVVFINSARATSSSTPLRKSTVCVSTNFNAGGIGGGGMDLK